MQELEAAQALGSELDTLSRDAKAEYMQVVERCACCARAVLALCVLLLCHPNPRLTPGHSPQDPCNGSLSRIECDSPPT